MFDHLNDIITSFSLEILKQNVCKFAETPSGISPSSILSSSLLYETLFYLEYNLCNKNIDFTLGVHILNMILVDNTFHKQKPI